MRNTNNLNERRKTYDMSAQELYNKNRSSSRTSQYNLVTGEALNKAPGESFEPIKNEPTKHELIAEDRKEPVVPCKLDRRRSASEASSILDCDCGCGFT